MWVDDFLLVIFKISGQCGQTQRGKQRVLDGSPKRTLGFLQCGQDILDLQMLFRLSRKSMGSPGSVAHCSSTHPVADDFMDLVAFQSFVGQQMIDDGGQGGPMFIVSEQTINLHS